jgi:hypothetical protein
MSKDLVVRQQMSVDDVSRVAKAYAMSGYWSDASDVAKAFVKVQFGYEVGLPAYVAMSEVHIIQGKPTLGAGALSALVKSHPNYDYRVTEHDIEVCAIEFFDARSGESLGVSRFTVEDAKTAGLLTNPTWSKYRRNMLFARAMSNGVAWFCPDVTMGRVYTPEEMGGTYTPEELGDEAVDADVVEDERPGVAAEEAPVAADVVSGEPASVAEPPPADDQPSFADLIPEGARGES